MTPLLDYFDKRKTPFTGISVEHVSENSKLHCFFRFLTAIADENGFPESQF
jgi:hypothetical protein